MSFKATRSSRRHRISRPESQESEKPFFQPLTPAAPVQAKLTVGAPDDRYEREADAVADRVVSSGQAGGNPAVQAKTDSRMEEDRAIQEKRDPGAGPRVQRTTAVEEEEPIQQMGDEEEEPIQQMGDQEEEEPPVQAKASPGESSALTDQFAGRLRQRAGKGQALGGAVKDKMETGFGRDFSGVGIHTDTAADEMNRELGARAFARGNDIYFRSGEYNPDTAGGQRLLAHELTHTVQQGGPGISCQTTPAVQQTPDGGGKEPASLPDFETMWNAFPKGSAKEVKEAIGGKVNYDWVTNTCAIRISRVLNYTGHPIPYTKIEKEDSTEQLTISGKDKKWYFFRIRNLRPFIELQFGPPDVTLQAPFDLQELAKYKGIILFDVDVWEDATGHYTLWNGTTCADHCYFDKAKTVSLWTK